MRLDILLGCEYKGSSGWARSFISITQSLPLTSVPFSLHLMLVVGVVKFPEDVLALFPFPCPFKHKGDASGREVGTRRSVVVFLWQDPEGTNRPYYPCPALLGPPQLCPWPRSPFQPCSAPSAPAPAHGELLTCTAVIFYYFICLS